ncbi:hypothetical protein FSARC_14894, partial [Fusarium sarcochroum]
MSFCKNPAIQGLHDNITPVGALGTVLRLMSMLSKIAGATGNYRALLTGVAETYRLSVPTVLKDQDPTDVISWLLKTEDEHDRSAPRGDGAFQEDACLMTIAS